MLAFALQPIGSASAAATCTRSACNYVNPYGTTCWNDAYNPVGYKSASGASGTVYNYNKYSPGCIANWSYTKNSAGQYKWLAAETQNFTIYNGTQTFVYVYDTMEDGSGTVCTRGKQGSSYLNYDAITAWLCA